MDAECIGLAVMGALVYVGCGLFLADKFSRASHGPFQRFMHKVGWLLLWWFAPVVLACVYWVDVLFDALDGVKRLLGGRRDEA